MIEDVCTPHISMPSLECCECCASEKYQIGKKGLNNLNNNFQNRLTLFLEQIINSNSHATLCVLKKIDKPHMNPI